MKVAHTERSDQVKHMDGETTDPADDLSYTQSAVAWSWGMGKPDSEGAPLPRFKSGIEVTFSDSLTDATVVGRPACACTARRVRLSSHRPRCSLNEAFWVSRSACLPVSAMPIHIYCFAAVCCRSRCFNQASRRHLFPAVPGYGTADRCYQRQTSHSSKEAAAAQPHSGD